VHVRTFSTIALSLGLGLLTGGLGVPQAAVAAPAGVTVTRAPAPVARAAAARSQLAGLRVVSEAARHRGKPYLFGASGPNRFDCSGFTMYVYRKTTGKSLPHKADLQQRYGRAVSKSAARPGDLIILRNGSYGFHAGIYAGGGRMWAAPRAGKTITKQKIWSRNYVVRRLT
jgi:cell wall-associated NlpC family hydrolase